MSASSAPAVKAALLGLFRGDATLGAVQVAYAHPDVSIQQESVYFAGTVEEETAVALGRRRRDEDYRLELVVDVVQDGDDAEAAETRCWALVARVENLIRENPGQAGDALASAVSGWVVYRSCQMTPHILAGQRLAEAVCQIAVKHRK